MNAVRDALKVYQELFFGDKLIFYTTLSLDMNTDKDTKAYIGYAMKIQGVYQTKRIRRLTEKRNRKVRDYLELIPIIPRWTVLL